VVLMDVQMPELDGVGATREIRALPPPKGNIPIIALTANAMAGDEKRYLEAGMNAYVSKPIQPAELFAKLANMARPVPADRPDSATPLAGTAITQAPGRDEGEAIILDLEKLAALRAVLPMDSVCGLLDLFVADTANYVGRTLECAASDDLDGVARNTHVIISTAGNMGAAQLSALARQLTEACHARDSRAVAGLAKQLESANRATSHAVQLWLAEAVPGEDARPRSAAS
jgi:HPt (histidine-containing phosphotransfer) domain-containing protein